ncbi:MAG: hypothetical protein ACK58L_20030 [Planctomycetota bacterium]
MSIVQNIRGLWAASTKQRPRNVRRFDQRRFGTLAGELLEDRRVLAGNMTVVYDAGSKLLTVAGDANGNEVVTRFDAPGAPAPTIYGLNGTTLNGNASLDIGVFTGGGEVTSVIVHAGEGDDAVTFDTSVNPLQLPATTINGGGGNDSVFIGSTGGAAINFELLTINGDAGNDNIQFLSSLWLGVSCQIDGGADNDTYVFDTDQPLGTINVSDTLGGVDTLDFSLTGSQNISVDLLVPVTTVNPNMQLNLAGGSRLERILGGSQNDTLLGDGFDNELFGNGGDDTLEGRLGNNTLNGGSGNDRYEIGARTTAETDTLVDGSGLDYLLMSLFNSDIVINLSAAPGPQTVSGNLVLNLNGSHFTGVSTGNGNDKITGRASLGTAMNGNFGNDQLSGGSGNDFLYGSPGIDSLAGWGGNDTYIFDTDGTSGTTSIFDQGAGTDTLDFSPTTTLPITVDLVSTSPQVVNAGLTLKLNSGSVIENVIGGAMQDTIYGNELVNQLNGSGPNDVLIGNGNSDQFAFDLTLSDGMTARVRAGVPQQTVNLSGITDSVGQNRPLSVTATSSNTTLIPTPSVSYVSPGQTGTLNFTPVAGQSGNATITVLVTDGGPDNNLATPGDNVTVPSVFYVEVTSTVSTFTSPSASAPQRPTFSWTPVSGAALYQLTVTNLSTGVANVVNTIVSATSFTPSSDLGIGRFAGWVRAITAGGAGLPWTPARFFRIETPVTVLPMAYMQPTPRPTVTWNALAGAVRYDVSVVNVFNGQVAYRNTGFQGTSWTPTADLPLGIYRFWVRGIDASGTPAYWSAAREFAVANSPVPVAPVTSTFNQRPTFAWDSVTASAGLSLTYIVSLTNTTTGASMTVNGLSGMCWVPTSNLPNGVYRWYVQGVLSNSFRTIWSNPAYFTVGGRPTLLPTSGATPTISWQSVTGAGTYNIWVDRMDVFQRGVINVTGIVGTSYTRPTPLAPGRYRVWVQAVSTTAVMSDWSVPLDFTVAAGTPSFNQSGSSDVAMQLDSDREEADLVPVLVEQVIAATDGAREYSVSPAASKSAIRVAASESSETRSAYLISDRSAQDGMSRPGDNRVIRERLDSEDELRPAIGLVDELMTSFATRDFTLEEVG